MLKYHHPHVCVRPAQKGKSHREGGSIVELGRRIKEGEPAELVLGPMSADDATRLSSFVAGLRWAEYVRD